MPPLSPLELHPIVDTGLFCRGTWLLTLVDTDETTCDRSNIRLRHPAFNPPTYVGGAALRGLAAIMFLDLACAAGCAV